MRHWIERGEEDDEGIYRDFFEEVTRAEGVERKKRRGSIGSSWRK